MRIGKLFDININLHYSWFFIVILLAWSLATDYFPLEYPGFTTASYWIFGVAAGILLFVCVLAHELSHSLVAKHEGQDVKGITLFFFGGVAAASEENLTPSKEFKIAIAGPLLSTALSGIFFLLLLVPLSYSLFPVIDYLFKVNLILAAFNMIPGFPLDGGRVFRSIAWKFTGSLRKSTQWASTGGRIFGGGMILGGMFFLFTSGGGLWYILLGGFLYLLAKASYEQVVMKEDLETFKVKDVMEEDFEIVKMDESLENFMSDFTAGGKKPVVKERQEFYLLDFEKLRNIPRHNWPVKQVKDMAVKVKPLRESYDAYKALMKMHEQGANMLPVVKKEKVTGVVTIKKLMSFLG